MFFHLDNDGMGAFILWLMEPHRVKARCWIGDLGHEVVVIDKSAVKNWPDGARVVFDKLVTTDVATMRIIRAINPTLATAVGTRDSLYRPRRQKDYSRRLGHNLSPWSDNCDEGINKSLANVTFSMLGKYPETKKEAMRALAQSKKGDERKVDETGSRFAQPKQSMGRKVPKGSKAWDKKSAPQRDGDAGDKPANHGQGSRSVL